MSPVLSKQSLISHFVPANIILKSKRNKSRQDNNPFFVMFYARPNNPHPVSDRHLNSIYTKHENHIGSLNFYVENVNKK